MKLGQAIYEKEQAAGATTETGEAAQGTEAGGGEEVVDAEFSEVDENKG
jgi:molecular chaperone DnaK